MTDICIGILQKVNDTACIGTASREVYDFTLINMLGGGAQVVLILLGAVFAYKLGMGLALDGVGWIYKKVEEKQRREGR